MAKNNIKKQLGSKRKNKVTKLEKSVGFTFRYPMPSLNEIIKIYTYKNNDKCIFMKNECLEELNRSRDNARLQIEIINSKMRRITNSSIHDIETKTFRGNRERHFLKEKKEHEMNIYILSDYIKTIENIKK